MHFRRARVDGERVPERRFRVLWPAEIEQEQAEIVLYERVVGMVVENPVIFRFGIGGAPRVPQQHREVDAGRYVVGRDGQCAPKRCLGFRLALLGAQDEAEMVERRRPVRIDRQRQFECVLRLRPLPAAVKPAAEMVERVQPIGWVRVRQRLLELSRWIKRLRRQPGFGIRHAFTFVCPEIAYRPMLFSYLERDNSQKPFSPRISHSRCTTAPLTVFRSSGARHCFDIRTTSPRAS